MTEMLRRVLKSDEMMNYLKLAKDRNFWKVTVNMTLNYYVHESN